MRSVRPIFISPKVRDALPETDITFGRASPGARSIMLISHVCRKPRRPSEGDITMTDSKRIPVTLSESGGRCAPSIREGSSAGGSTEGRTS